MDIQEVTLPGELWKPIAGFEGFYDVSNMGRVWSAKTAKLLQGAAARGCSRVTLFAKKRARYAAIHQLVLEAFVGPRPPGMECCHNDGNPANNHVENLRWDTHASNMADMIRHGSSPRGCRNASAKLTPEQVAIIRERYERRSRGPNNARALGIEFGVSESQLYRIVARKRWAHVDAPS